MLNTLPKVIIAKILFGLPIIDLFRSRRTCKLFAEIITLQNIDNTFQNLTGQEFLWIEYLFLKYPYNFIWGSPVTAEKMPLDVILRYPEREWSFVGFLMNKDVTWEMAQEYCRNSPIKFDHNHSKSNFASYFSHNPNVSLDIITERLDLPWEWSILSRNKAFTIKDVLSNPDLPWYNNCYAFLATEEDIINNRNIFNSQDRMDLFLNENLSLDFLEKKIKISSYIDLKRKSRALARRKDLTWEELQKIPQDYWSCQSIAENKNISWENICGMLNGFNISTLAIYRPREVALYCELGGSDMSIHWKLVSGGKNNFFKIELIDSKINIQNYTNVEHFP